MKSPTKGGEVDRHRYQHPRPCPPSRFRVACTSPVLYSVARGRPGAVGHSLAMRARVHRHREPSGDLRSAVDDHGGDRSGRRLAPVPGGRIARGIRFTLAGLEGTARRRADQGGRWFTTPGSPRCASPTASPNSEPRIGTSAGSRISRPATPCSTGPDEPRPAGLLPQLPGAMQPGRCKRGGTWSSLRPQACRRRTAIPARTSRGPPRYRSTRHRAGPHRGRRPHAGRRTLRRPGDAAGRAR